MRRNILVGLDIGGTKCAVSIGRVIGSRIEILDKKQFPTPASPEKAIKQLEDTIDDIIQVLNLGSIDAIGISCGGPLDSKRGLILSPPNLPNWDKVDVITPFKQKYGVPAGLQNDANACALAEWKWGAGQGASNMIFLTFGTGMGAGLIMNGSLYTGTNDMAGEVGHIRLEEDGPLGYGKYGSFEGFCSGGGIANLAKAMAESAINEGKAPSFCPSLEKKEMITAKSVGIAAEKGDPLAIKVYHEVGRKLGRGLAILVDLLNPERIIIGSIYGRQQDILEPIVKEELQKESLNITNSVCEVLPSGLEEQVGDFASLSVALHTIEK
ncbi:ROK family transcriptional regulator [Bacillus sp. SA1-12]|uniref:ROK family protein n=1 Tax=Bacillus sp. SA1-12 TaxID=1455638 RepID=UPI000626F978|nr:ROK family protein [Bacillus sp. SA1-12]KKI90175.1 ROK family transcriptional regulator [Bacillus sp. SA1-12]